MKKSQRALQDERLLGESLGAAVALSEAVGVVGGVPLLHAGSPTGAGEHRSVY